MRKSVIDAQEQNTPAHAQDNRSQPALPDSEIHFRQILEHSPFGTALYDLEGRLSLANPAFRELWALSAEESAALIGSYCVFDDPQMHASGAIDYFRRALEGEITEMPPLKYTREPLPRNGEPGQPYTRWIEGSLYPVRDAAGVLVELVLMQRDVTEQVQLAEQLQQRQRELQSLLATNRDLSGVLDLDHLLRLIASRAAMLMETDSFTLYVVDDDQTQLRPYLSLGKYADEMMVSCVAVGEGITGMCVATSAPILANNAHLDPRAAQVDDTPEDEVEHLMAAPLVFRDHAFGAMLVSRLSEQVYTEDDLEIFSALAGQAAVAIKNAHLYEQVHKHAAELEDRVAERTMELAAANRKLLSLGRIKDEFVSNVSHELRTPIANIKLYHGLLLLNPAKQAAYMATLERETLRLEHIVEDLLALSRLTQGTAPLKFTQVNLNTLATTYAADRAPLAERNGLTLSVHQDPMLPDVPVDERRIGQALGILLTNAINYTPPGGRIDLHTTSVRTENQDWADLAVADTGPGIPKSEQPHLFDRFYRGSAANASNAPGTGLGLAIAKTIIDKHGGRLLVSSDGLPGRGSVFTIRIPLDNNGAQGD